MENKTKRKKNPPKKIRLTVIGGLVIKKKKSLRPIPRWWSVDEGKIVFLVARAVTRGGLLLCKTVTVVVVDGREEGVDGKRDWRGTLGR